jgi:hypothetical protein
LEWGTATAADGNIELTIAAESGLVLVGSWVDFAKLFGGGRRLLLLVM